MLDVARAPLGHYRDMPSTPLYEFGHGQSFTTYEYGKLQAPALVLGKTDELAVEIPVTHVGEREGMETVMWFINNPACTVSRPIKKLKFFEKQTLKPDETRTFRSASILGGTSRIGTRMAIECWKAETTMSSSKTNGSS